jgi:predicted nuclease of predicted toxin-antitoxin system
LKLLLDQNLSRKLVSVIEPRFPGSAHVLLLGLDRAPDAEIRDFARFQGFTLVTKNTDMVDLCLLRGAPPKVIWLRIGNCSTDVVRETLLTNISRVESFGLDDKTALTLFRFMPVA